MSNSKYINDWIKENKETIKVQVPKGKKAIIEEHRKARGYTSTNQYINDLIDADLNANKKTQPIKKDLPDPGIRVAKL